METQGNFSGAETNQTPPSNNMGISVIGTIAGIFSPCCIGLIVGIIAIVMSSQVNSKFTAGNYHGAVSSAKNAKVLGYIALALGVIGLIISIVSIITMGGISGYMEQYMEILDQIGG